MSRPRGKKRLKYLNEFERRAHAAISVAEPTNLIFTSWRGLKTDLWASANAAFDEGRDCGEAATAWFELVVRPRLKAFDESRLNEFVPGLGELTRIWEREGFRLELYDPNKFVFPHWYVGYLLRDLGNTIFRGTDIGMAPGVAVDGDLALETVLFWCAGGPDEHLTERQEVWRESERGGILEAIRIDLHGMCEAVAVRETSWCCSEWFDGPDNEHSPLDCSSCYERFDRWRRLRDAVSPRNCDD